MSDIQEYLDGQHKELRGRVASFSVAPCYSAGSPAKVDRDTAYRVAREEHDSYNHVLAGMYGEPAQASATLRGLEGIAYCWAERGKGAEVRDLITNEYREFRRFEEFQAWGKANRERTARFHDVMYRNTHDEASRR